MTQTKTQIFYSGNRNNSIRQLINQNENKSPRWTPLSKIKNANKVRKIVSGYNHNCLIWKGINNLEFHRTNNQPKSFTIENEEIKDIQSGYSTYLILTKSGNIFSLAQEFCYCEVPLSDPESSNYEKIRPVPFFNKKENNRKVETFAMVGWSNYFVCKDGKLFGNGYNAGRLGDGTSNQAKNLPVLIFENVTRVFGGVQGYSFFFTTKNNELYTCGENQYGCLGTGNSSNQKSPVKVPKWKAEDILDLQTNDGYSILITKEGKTYGCGSAGFNGFTQDKSTFTEIEELKNKKVVEYFGGSRMSLALTNENELFGWGFYTGNHPTDQYGNINIQIPHKFNLPEIFQNNPSIKLKITCGTECIYLYPSYNNCLIQDFQKLFESKIFCDSKLSLNENIQVPIHKIIVESRTNLQISTIENLLNNESFSKQEILLFLKWVYFDEITNVDLLKQIFNSLNLSFPPKNTFQKDLHDLFNDEDSKDFTLLIKNDDEDEDEYEEIPVHKIILLTRSGLFREMFENITEESQSVKDYSGKSIESIEILIKYFYTEKIELTADHDPLLVIEELEDSIEYYQLNENSNILIQLNEIKNKL
ncbi:regulator of chromosome condensation [Anaeramoeba flamelloides]|uniref:Regulator of chromosome condensation n=1 Tax=Anaeramoeba flamelloides TaxID=1746091 RepID=A0AAV7Z702_9EUKA|nr:regulator of chromosome condensation [Anaeramoeba flamelloides]